MWASAAGGSRPFGPSPRAAPSPRAMRVACIRAHGGLGEMRLEDWPEPVPGRGQALVEIACCGLNQLDLFVIKGMPGVAIEMPRITGGDIAGTVSAVGAGADAAWVGRRVLIDPLI
ncbi:MAG: hypothetical protein FJX51_06055, partial [Alphaproteobacteria bacterium]|nr:hypothetical protein [Alphaproteobacteria bacterium]